MNMPCAGSRRIAKEIPSNIEVLKRSQVFTPLMVSWITVSGFVYLIRDLVAINRYS